VGRERIIGFVGTTLVNRVCTFLSFAGMFVAGVLSLGHLLGLTVPCGAGNGCQDVARHPSSVWFGVPVAVIGFVAYLALAAISVLRGAKGTEHSRSLVNLGFALTSVALLVQTGLTFYALLFIQKTCDWCLASNGILLLLFLAHAILSQQHAKGASIRPASGSAEWAYAGALAILTLGGLGAMASLMRSEAAKTPISAEAQKLMTPEVLVPKDGPFLGNPDAPITIVEFADLFCPACRSSYPMVHALVQESGGRIRLVFRHMPLYKLQGHEYSLVASTLAEIAKEKGRYFDFIEAVYEAPEDEIKTIDGLMSVLENLRIDSKQAVRRAQNPEDPAFKRMYADVDLTSRLGVQITPTYIILMDGVAPKVANSNSLREILSQPPYAPSTKSAP